LIQTLDLRSKSPDDLAGLKSQLGLEPASYKTFPKVRVKSDDPAPEPALAPDAHSLPSVPPQVETHAPEPPVNLSPAIHTEPPASHPGIQASQSTGYSPDVLHATRSLQKLARFSNWDRWSALDMVLDNSRDARLNLASHSQPKQIPAVSIAGTAAGIGTTSIVAALARISARRGGQVVVFDVSEHTLLSLFFNGRCSSIPNASFVFSGDTNRGAIHTFRRDENNCAESTEAWLSQTLDALTPENDELLVDAGVNRGRCLRHAAIGDSIEVLTLVPDTRCLAALKRLEDARQQAADFSPAPYLLLNQFDQSDPLHTEIRSRLVNCYPHRLIPIAIRRDRQVPAALAEGMTVIDYAPESSASEDIALLCQWFRALQQQNSSHELEKVQIL
jgi:cellulose biosynthesis protein BcsQ